MSYNKNILRRLIETNIRLKRFKEEKRIFSLYSISDNKPWNTVLLNFPEISSEGIDVNCNNCHNCEKIFWEHVSNYLNNKYDSMLEELLSKI